MHNVIVMHCHDLGRYVAILGHPGVSTPNIDRLMRGAVRFREAFATAPQCSPSRASLFTGRWPHANGVMGLTHGNFAWDLLPGELHLARRLRDAGYATGLVGVHHESRKATDEDIAARLGFDHVRAGAMDAGEVVALAFDALDQLESRALPYYLQVGFFEPHRQPGARDAAGTMGFLGDRIPEPTTLPNSVPPYLENTAPAREELAELYAAIAYVDAAIGRLVDRFEELGLFDRSIVVFTTDHGVAMPRSKCTLYEPGLEVALSMQVPEWAGDRDVTGLVSLLDIVPTVLDLLGLPPAPEVHGTALTQWATGERTDEPRAHLFAELTFHDYYDPRRSVRSRRYKLIANFSSAPAFMDSSQSWIRRTTPRVDLPSTSHPPIELYDLVNDPHELRDLAQNPDHAEVVRELSARLYRWMRETADPLLSGSVTSPLHTRTQRMLEDASR